MIPTPNCTHATVDLAVAALPRSGHAQKTTPAHWIPTWTTSQQLVRFPTATRRPPVSADCASARRRRQQPPTTAANTSQSDPAHDRADEHWRPAGAGEAREHVQRHARRNRCRPHRAPRQRLSHRHDLDRALTFGGASSSRSRPVRSSSAIRSTSRSRPLTDVAVSLYLPGETGPPTTHARGLRTTYISTEGNHTAARPSPSRARSSRYYWLAAIEVDAVPDARLIVTFGDSITDGSQSTPDTNNPGRRSWRRAWRRTRRPPTSRSESGHRRQPRAGDGTLFRASTRSRGLIATSSVSRA